MYTLRNTKTGLSEVAPKQHYQNNVENLIVFANIVGYARVSSTGQSLDVQLDKLAEHGTTKVFAEKQSG